jgi:hypothetical protein
MKMREHVFLYLPLVLMGRGGHCPPYSSCGFRRVDVPVDRLVFRELWRRCPLRPAGQGTRYASAPARREPCHCNESLIADAAQFPNEFHPGLSLFQISSSKGERPNGKFIFNFRSLANRKLPVQFPASNLRIVYGRITPVGGVDGLNHQ